MNDRLSMAPVTRNRPQQVRNSQRIRLLVADDHALLRQALRMLLESQEAKVWGREYMDETDYLKVHIQHLRRKLGDDPQSEPMIANERGVGYKFVRRQRADLARKTVR